MKVCSNKLFLMILNEFKCTEKTPEVVIEQFKKEAINWRIASITEQQIRYLLLHTIEREVLSDIERELRNLIDTSLEKTYDPDGTIIVSCKEVAKRHKIPYQFLLKDIRPRGVLNRTLWNEFGEPIAWEKLFR